MRGEQFREETPSRWSARIIICVGSRTIVDSVIAVAVAMRNGWPGQTPLTEVSGSEQRDDRLLALVRENGHLDLPALDEEPYSVSLQGNYRPRRRPREDAGLLAGAEQRTGALALGPLGPPDAVG